MLDPRTIEFLRVQSHQKQLPRPPAASPALQPAGPSPRPVRQRPGRPARALQCSLERRTEPAPRPEPASLTPPLSASPDPQGSAPGKARGGLGGGRAASFVEGGGEGRAAGRRAGPALPRGGGERWDPGARGRRCRPVRRPAGRGSGCPRGGKVPRQPKCPGTAGGGGEGASSSLRQKRKRREGNGGGGSGQHRPEQIPPLPPARHLSPPSPPPHPRRAPERGGTDGLLPLGQCETPLPPTPPFCQRLSQRARTWGDCAAPPGEGARRVREERPREELRARAPHSVSARRGDAAAPRPPSPARGECQRQKRSPAPGDAARLSGARAATATAGSGARATRARRCLALLAGLPAPRRPAGRGREGGARRRAERRPPADGCGAPGAGRQLCRVTRGEDCRARGRGFRAARERTALPGALRTALAPLRSAPAPPAGPRRGRPARGRHRRLFLRGRRRE